MKRLAVCLFIAITASALAQQASPPGTASSQRPAQDTAASSKPSATMLAAGTIVDVELTKSLDAKKSKAGDTVEARVRTDVKQNGQVVIKRGAKVMGHVSQARTKSKAEPSEVMVTFDTVVAKDGEMLPLVAAIQALGAAPRQRGVTDSGMVSSATGVGPPAGGGPGQASMGPQNTSIAGSPGVAGNSANMVTGGPGAADTLSASSRGVFGMPGVGLKNEVVNNSVRSTVLAVDENVHLDSGTQIILRVLGP
jgi:hypothetical protein